MRRSLLIASVAALLLIAAPSAHAATFGSRQIRIGSRGSDVVQLQKALRTLGYDLATDGDFGPITDRAVRSYERKHHMTVDGIVGSREAKQMLADAAAAKASSPPPPAAAHVFPVLGSFSFGGADARFGAPRSGHTHQGQDMMAAEGTTVVSVSAGLVHSRRYQAGGAGNYVVIQGDDGYDYVYMHFREGSLVQPGERVEPGTPIGHVGHTGAASGPHLHFEIWAGGHWQAGGHPIDPLPFLTSWL